jgi:hypothetical protein
MTHEVCTCGHGRDAHEHYRPGTECSLCAPGDCQRYRAASLVTGLKSRARRLLAVVTSWLAVVTSWPYRRAMHGNTRL